MAVHQHNNVIISGSNSLAGAQANQNYVNSQHRYSQGTQKMPRVGKTGEAGVMGFAQSTRAVGLQGNTPANAS